MREPQALTTSTETGRDAAQHCVTLRHWRIPVRLALRFFAEMKAMIGIVQADRRAPVDRVALAHYGQAPRIVARARIRVIGPAGTPAPPTTQPSTKHISSHFAYGLNLGNSNACSPSSSGPP